MIYVIYFLKIIHHILNKIIPDDCKVLNLAGKFNSEIERLRKEYLNLFTDLSKKHDSLEWWSSQIASRLMIKKQIGSIINICFQLKVLGLLVEERYLADIKINNFALSYVLPKPYTYKSDTLDSSSIDTLYSEFFLLNI